MKPYFNQARNKHNKPSRCPGPSCKFWAEAKLNNTVYFVYTWLAVCTVQLIKTWRQAGLSRVFVDYSETWCCSLIYVQVSLFAFMRFPSNKSLLFTLIPIQSSLVIFIFCCRLCCYYARMPQEIHPPIANVILYPVNMIEEYRKQFPVKKEEVQQYVFHNAIKDKEPTSLSLSYFQKQNFIC